MAGTYPQAVFEVSPHDIQVNSQLASCRGG